MRFLVRSLGRMTVAGLVMVGIVADAHAGQSEGASAKREIRVLGIGNSFTGNAFALLQPMGELSRDVRLILGRAIIGGCSMEKHLRLAKLHDAEPDNPEGLAYSLPATNAQGERTQLKVGLREMLVADQWDIVTIQQLSRDSTDIATYRPYARQLYDYIKAHAPQAEVVLHQTWAYRTDGDFAQVFPDKRGYGQREMYLDLNEAYHTIARELGTRLIPVGTAFQLAREARPFLPDTRTDRQALKPPALPQDRHSLCTGWSWAKSSGAEDFTLRCDTHHAGIQGQYLAASVWFEFLTGRSPCAEGIQVGDLSDEDARFLGGIARRVVREGKRPSVEFSR